MDRENLLCIDFFRKFCRKIDAENVSCIDLSTSLFYVFFSVSHSVKIILDDFMIAKTIASEWY